MHTDSTLSFFSLPFFDPIPTSFIQPIKGVSCFSHDIGEEGRIGEDGTIELSVIKRRAIQIYKIGESMHLKKVKNAQCYLIHDESYKRKYNNNNRNYL